MKVAGQPADSEARTKVTRGRAKRNGVHRDDYDALVSRLQSLGYGTERNGWAIGVTSSVRGEGTTTVVANLAAHAGQSAGSAVLVIDANFFCPALHRVFHVNQEPGMVEVLEGELHPAQIVQPTRLPNVSLVTTGNVTDAMQRRPPIPRMAAVIEELSSSYDWIFVDLPAANPPSPCVRIAPKLHGVLFVVGAEQVSGSAAARTKVQLEDQGTNLLGIVFNKRRRYLPTWLENGSGGS